MKSKLTRFRAPTLTIEHLWLGVPIFILVWKGFRFPVPLLDFWWHLKAGEVILRTSTIPRIDLFSFTAAGKPFILGNWLAETIYNIVYRLGGLELLVFVNTILLVTAFLPVYDLCLRATSNVRIGAVSATMLALGMVVSIRTQVFSFVMFAAYYWILSEYYRGRKDFLWFLPVGMAFWVNLHGAFASGLLLLVLYCTFAAFRELSDGAMRRASDNRAVKLLSVTILCFVASLINPEMHRIYGYFFTVLGDTSSQKYVMEWQPPQINSLQGVLLFFAPFFLVFCGFVYSKRKPELEEFVLVLVFGVFALLSLRNCVWFVMIVAPMVARYLPVVEFGTAQDSGLTKRMSWFLRPSPGARSGAATKMNLLLASLSVCVLILVSPWVYPKVYGASLLDSHTPVGAMDFIERHSLEGNIFHPQVFGDYLIWRCWPRQRSFIDGRVHLFGEGFVEEYQRILCDSDWRGMLKKYDIRYLLLEKAPGDKCGERMISDARRSDSWKIMYEDEVSILWEAVTPCPSCAKN